MSILTLIASVSLAAASLTATHSERRCPGNVDSVPLRQLQGALPVVAVTVNGRGPFDFLIDSGTQLTVVDSQIAAQLGLESIGSTGISAIASRQRKIATSLAHMQIGGHHVENMLAVVEDMAELHQADPKLRGIVAENFLAHFDFLIDYEHRVLCLDESGTMAAAIRGARLPLAQPYSSDRDLPDLPFTRPLVIAAQLAGSRTPTLLCLDSGSNTPFLFASSQFASSPVASSPDAQAVELSKVPIRKWVVAGIEQSFAVLPPRQVAIAGHILGQIAFLQPINSVGTPSQLREDGTLPTAIFKRVFVSYNSQFAILEPR
jgi:predicted aspartyl protease